MKKKDGKAFRPEKITAAFNKFFCISQTGYALHHKNPIHRKMIRPIYFIDTLKKHLQKLFTFKM
jgi:hypothetical protein